MKRYGNYGSQTRIELMTEEGRAYLHKRPVRTGPIVIDVTTLPTDVARIEVYPHRVAYIIENKP